MFVCWERYDAIAGMTVVQFSFPLEILIFCVLVLSYWYQGLSEIAHGSANVWTPNISRKNRNVSAPVLLWCMNQGCLFFESSRSAGGTSLLEKFQLSFLLCRSNHVCKVLDVDSEISFIFQLYLVDVQREKRAHVVHVRSVRY